MRSSRRRVCALSICDETVYKDPRTGQEHHFCGRTHATLYQQQQQSLQHQATLRPDRATGGRNKLMSMLRPGAMQNLHKTNSTPSGPHASAAIGAFPPAQQTLPITHHTSIAQALRVTDTMVLFWNPPCVFTQWEPASFQVDGVSSVAESAQSKLNKFM